jgi:inorganic triphosphatase YgiF
VLPEGRIVAGPPSAKRLRTVYFDTRKFALRAGGISLRVRWQGEERLQTVKAERRITNGLSDALEHESSIESDMPDLKRIGEKKLRRIVQKLSKGTALLPIFESVVTRTSRQLSVDGSDIELAIDEGEVRANGTSRQLREAELELKSGTPAGLLAAAEALFKGQELKLSTRSKADRGYQLVLGKPRGSTRARTTRLLDVSRKQSCAEAFAEILSSSIEQVVGNRQAVLETGSPHAVHELRIGLRRLRSTLRALRPLVAAPSLKEFERLAREVATGIGPLRDSDVLMDIIHAPAGAAADSKGFAELTAALALRRQAKLDEAHVLLRGALWTHLQLYLTLWPRTLEETAKLGQQILPYAGRLLQKRWRKVVRLGRRLDALDEEGRHELRKLLKDLRYLSEFFMPLFKQRDVRSFVKRLRALLDMFGYVNDVRATAQLRQIQEQEPMGRGASYCAGFIRGWHEAAARQRRQGLEREWERLRLLPRFWT